MKKKLFVLLLALAMCLSLLPITTPAVEPTAASTTISALPVVTLGANCEAVKLMQTRLKELGYDCGAVDGIFGSKTHAAVTAFQKDMGIAVDGITGPITWDKLFPGGDTTSSLGTASVMATISSDMPLVLFGSSGEAVKILQEKLNALGYDCGAVDGKFGAKTLAAVKAYQTAKGLTADGKVGPLTWGSMTATGNSSGRSHRHSDPEPDYSNCVFKAVLDGSDEANITLTFYFDESDHDADGESILLFDELPTTAESYEDWGYFELSEFIQRVVIDSSVKNYTGLTSTAYMFCNMKNAQSITGAENLNVSNVTDMSYMFYYFGGGSTTLNTVPDVSKWDTSKVEDMRAVFYAYGFNSEVLNVAPDISKWNTANVTNMSFMFYMYGGMSQALNVVPDVSKWNTANVTDMSFLFCTYGYSSNVLNAVPDVSKWDTSNVTTMECTFCSYGAASEVMQFELDLTGWSLESLENGEDMFYQAGMSVGEWSVTIPGKSGSKSNNAKGWYYNGGDYIAPAAGRSFTSDGPVFKAVYDTADDANILTFYYDKADHSSQGTVYNDPYDEDFGWAYSAVCGSVKKVVIDASVADYDGLVNTADMFAGMSNAASITGAEYLDVSNVTSMSNMFSGFGYNSTTLAEVPNVSGWDTSKVTNMYFMFHEYGYSSTVLNAVPDVSSWNTSNVELMSDMFEGYGRKSTVLSSVPNVNGWNTAKVKTMYRMFSGYGYNSTALNFTLNLSGWNVESVGTGDYNYGTYSYNEMFSGAGNAAPTWSVTIPTATGDKANDEGHWYLSDGTSAITPHSGKNFTVAGE